MLANLLALDQVSTKQKQGGSLNEIQHQPKNIEAGSQFSKILSSLDDGTKLKQNAKNSETFLSLQTLFEDDKEFLKDALSLLAKNDTKSNLKNLKSSNNSSNSNLATSTKTGIKTKEEELDLKLDNQKNQIIFGLNLNNFQVANASDEAFKVTINKAKDFLKNELKKISIPESEMPQTLRGLVELANAKGIAIKDIKLSAGLETDEVKTLKNLNKSDPNLVVETGNSSNSGNSSQDSLLRNRSMAFILKAGITDQTPQNLTNSSEIAENTKNINAKFDLATFLQNPNSETINQVKTTSSIKTNGLNLSKEVSSLSDVLAVKNEIGDTKAVKSFGAIDKIAKFTGIDTPILNSLFSEDEFKDLGISSISNIALEENINSDNNLLSGLSSSQVREPLDLKIGEAKTMSRHLAQNLKEQIENYKSPFQKISLTLNPAQLGEVEVDILKRGNSVKITLSGSTQTIGILSAYAPELRNQLVSAGLENPTFKFNEDGRGNNGGDRREDRRQNNSQNSETSELFEINIDSLLVA